MMSSEQTIELIKSKQDIVEEATYILLHKGGFDGVLQYIRDAMINPDEAFIIGHRVATLAAEAARGDFDDNR